MDVAIHDPTTRSCIVMCNYNSSKYAAYFNTLGGGGGGGLALPSSVSVQVTLSLIGGHSVWQMLCERLATRVQLAISTVR